jgi:hypothetical protein
MLTPPAPLLLLLCWHLSAKILGFPVQLVGLLALPYLGVRWFVDGKSAGKDIEEAVVSHMECLGWRWQRSTCMGCGPLILDQLSALPSQCPSLLVHAGCRAGWGMGGVDSGQHDSKWVVLIQDSMA